MMTADHFIKLSKKGEGATIEYKTCTEQISESLYETVCSFLNHSGGHILVGVRNNGEIVGVSPEKAETLKANIITAIKNQELFLPCPYFTPQIIAVCGKTVIYLDIPCGQYVYRYKDRYWDRNGDADIDITDQPELMLTVFERKNPHLFEERIAEDLTMVHLDHDTFQFCRNILAVKKPEHAWLQLSDDLPSGTTQRVDLRLELFREIIANLCVHADYSAGYACFYHVFKDRVVTKNPTRLLPEIPEGQLTLRQLSNYTKNPLLVRVFHELSWVEDMGSGTRNILRYAPLYYPGYNVEINSSSQFIFSITYTNVSQETGENVPRNNILSQETGENVPRNDEMSQKTVNDDDLNISSDDAQKHTKATIKKHKRQQGIISLIRQNPGITIEEMAERLDANERTIKRDIEALKNIIKHVGPTKGGTWIIIKK